MDAEGAPSVASFRAAVNTAFGLDADGLRVGDMTLLEVAVTDRHPAWECFSLLFEGPAPALPQAIYGVDHADLGSFKLFLVPILSPQGMQHYEAVFNRPTP